MDALIAEKYLHTAQNLPFLQTLKLRLWYNDDDDDIQDCLSVFCDAPALYTVHLYGRVHPAMYILPWHQLTDFLGEHFTVDQCLQVLRGSPRLIQCNFVEVRCLTNAGDPIHISTKTPFPPNFFLESLTISNEAESNRDGGVTVYQHVRLLDSSPHLHCRNLLSVSVGLDPERDVEKWSWP
ncbi:hypothetical protein C8R44DRAFT_880120 [Mycena epipterygia]|nr:hypothetical protein C8R44DRAFT_880120 [Mycena epipterygia]